MTFKNIIPMFEWKKPYTKRVHTAWVHLYEVQRLAKLIYVNRNHNSGRRGEWENVVAEEINCKEEPSYFIRVTEMF